jgi:hypothetical protein
VGDYALHLARQLRKDFGVQTHFIVGNPSWLGASEIEGFPVSQVTNNSANALFEVLSDRPFPVLLHYVGYGYAKRGCPIWLVDGLQRWKSLYPQRSLVTMFHEIYATSDRPWTSAFWLSSLQKNLATRLAQMSDRCITSKQLYSEIITQISKGKHKQVPFMPVFSNVGEPERVPPLSDRQKQLVIFGGVANRIRVYQESEAVLDQVCQILDIQEILDIGTPTGQTPQAIGDVPILELGQLPPEKISDIMSNAIAGFLNYNPDYLGKSTIFAAYCAHGLLPISDRGSNSGSDGIQAGEIYWNPSENELKDVTMMQVIAHNANSWYSSHGLVNQSKLFSHLLDF